MFSGCLARPNVVVPLFVGFGWCVPGGGRVSRWNSISPEEVENPHVTHCVPVIARSLYAVHISLYIVGRLLVGVRR